MRRAAALAVVLAAAVAGRAAAQGLPSMQTPSHNIFCQYEPADAGQPQDFLRCDIIKTTSRLPKAPKPCDGDYGNAFTMTPSGRPSLLCHGDTLSDPDDPVIAYGASWKQGGFVCESATSGLTCRNGAGHGFKLARAAQTLF